MTESSQERFTLATYCDDIRVEQGGKLTIVGVYNSFMLVSEMPAFIPKLAVWIVISTTLARPMSSVKVRVERGSTTLVEFAPPDLRTAETPRMQGQDEPTRASATVNVMLPPMTFAEPTTLRTIVEIDGLTYVAGKLHVGLMTGRTGNPEQSDDQGTGARRDSSVASGEASADGHA